MPGKFGGSALIYDQLKTAPSFSKMDEAVSHLYDYMPFSKDSYNAPIKDWNEVRGLYIDVFSSEAPAMISNEAHNQRSNYLISLVPLVKSNANSVTVNMEDVMITPFDWVSVEGIPHMGAMRQTQEGYTAENYKRSYQIDLMALYNENGESRLEQILKNFANDYHMTLGMNVSGALVLRATKNINVKALDHSDSVRHGFLAHVYEEHFLEAVSNPSTLLHQIASLNEQSLGLDTLLVPREWFTVIKSVLGNAERFKYKVPEGNEQASELVNAMKLYTGDDFLGTFSIGSGTPMAFFASPTFKVWSDDDRLSWLNTFLTPWVIGEIIMPPLKNPQVPSGDPEELDIVVTSVGDTAAKYMTIRLMDALVKSRGCYFYDDKNEPSPKYHAFVEYMNHPDNFNQFVKFFQAQQPDKHYDHNQESPALKRIHPGALNMMEEFRGLCPLVSMENGRFIVPKVVSQFAEAGLSTNHMLRVARGLAKVMEQHNVCTDKGVYDFLETMFPGNGVHINAYQVCLQRTKDDCAPGASTIGMVSDANEVAKTTLMGVMFYKALASILNQNKQLSVDEATTAAALVAATTNTIFTGTTIEDTLKNVIIAQCSGVVGGILAQYDPKGATQALSYLNECALAFGVKYEVLAAIYIKLTAMNVSVKKIEDAANITLVQKIAAEALMTKKQLSVSDVLKQLKVSDLDLDSLVKLIRTGAPERNALNLVPLKSNAPFASNLPSEEVSPYSALSKVHADESLDQYKGRLNASFLLQSQDKESLQLLSILPDQAFSHFIEASYGIQSNSKTSRDPGSYYSYYTDTLTNTSDTSREGYFKRLASNPSNYKPKVNMTEHNNQSPETNYTSNYRTAARQRLQDLESLQSKPYAAAQPESYGNFFFDGNSSSATRAAPAAQDWPETYDTAFRARFTNVNKTVRSNEGYAMCAFIALCYARNTNLVHKNLSKYGMCLFKTGYIRNSQYFITQMILAMHGGKETALQTVGDTVMTVGEESIKQNITFTHDFKHMVIFQNPRRIVGIPNAVPHEFLGGRDISVLPDVAHMGQYSQGSIIPIFLPVEETDYDFPLHLFDGEIFREKKMKNARQGNAPFRHRCSGMHYIMFLFGHDKVATDMTAVNTNPEDPWRLRLPYSVILHRSFAAYRDTYDKKFKVIDGNGPLGKWQMNDPDYVPLAYTYRSKGVPANNDRPLEIVAEA